MAFNGVNISIPFKFEIKTPPRGMIDYDPKALSIDELREIQYYKLNLRRENNFYLASHPEIRAITSLVVRMTAIHHPQNIIEFVAKLFTRPERQIREEVDKILNESKIEYQAIPYSDYEEFEY